MFSDDGANSFGQLYFMIIWTDAEKGVVHFYGVFGLSSLEMHFYGYGYHP